jgi:hypothetical protein
MGGRRRIVPLLISFRPSCSENFELDVVVTLKVLKIEEAVNFSLMKDLFIIETLLY